MLEDDSNNNTTDIFFRLPPRLFDRKNATILECIDCHAAGEPARVVLAGTPLPPQDCQTALAKRSYMMNHMDHLRRLLILEPRGYPCQNVNFVFPPPTPPTPIPENNNNNNNNNNNDRRRRPPSLQYVIAEQNKIYPAMSGHNTICVATALLETGVIPMNETTTTTTTTTNFTLEAPAGPIHITAHCQDGKAKSIVLKNAPSFVEHLDVVVTIPILNQTVVCDIAYGGMWYCVVDLSKHENQGLGLGSSLDPNRASELCRIGEMIKVACREQFPVNHPELDYPGCDILVFREPSNNNRLKAKNAVVMSNNELDWDRPETFTAMLDRSPCGTGTCAVMAVLHARGELHVGEEFIHESIVGTEFVGTILEETTIGEPNADDSKPAIVPQIRGSAYITQYSRVVVDSEYDPFPTGYRVGDIW